MNTRILRRIPSFNVIKSDERFLKLKKGMQYRKLKNKTDAALNLIRKEIISDNKDLTTGEILEMIFTYIEVDNNKADYQFTKIINATGVVLHTNLGRSILGENAIKEVSIVAKNYSDIEYDLINGVRGSRQSKVEELIKKLTGAESALVVNNNAAAVFLVLNSLAYKREVVVSKGELIEIGGSFRVSSIMEKSECFIKEIGTANKTHLKDYSRAINEKTALLMKVHKSNFQLVGFQKEVISKEISSISAMYGIPLYEDLGSGALFDFKRENIGNEPTVKKSLRYTDILSFSGDKLVGGPQCGIIVGKKEFINKIKENQLARVVRVDKLTLAALMATLENYLHENFDDVPTVKNILKKEEEILEAINSFSKRLESKWISEVVNEFSQVGGGSMPEVKLKTYLLLLSLPGVSEEIISERLRLSDPSIIARKHKNKIALDFRTIEYKDFDIILKTLNSINGGTV